MKTPRTVQVLALAGLLGIATGCTNMSAEGQGTLSGAAIGAAAGAGITAIAGGNAGVGAAVGAVAGGVAGNVKGRRDEERMHSAQ